MLWLTALLFLPVARTAWQCRRPLFSLAMYGLTGTSVLHHGQWAPFAGIQSTITYIDRTWAHVCGLWGVVAGIRQQQWHLLPHAFWAFVGFYHVEPRLPLPAQDAVHASIHWIAARAFHRLSTQPPSMAKFNATI